MKKLFISLLAMAATVNAMAISFAGKATITLTSANNESCAIIVAESDELADGLNNGYYAVINMENREVALYAIYGGSNYQQFATKSLEDIALGVKTSAATDYTLTVSNVSGSKTLKLKIGDEVIELTEGLSKNLTLTPNQAALAFGTLEPSAPLVQGICFNYNKLQLTKYAGATVEVFADGAATATRTENVVGDAMYEIDLSNEAAGKYKVVVTVPGATPEEYIIDVKPAVTVVP